MSGIIYIILAVVIIGMTVAAFVGARARWAQYREAMEVYEVEVKNFEEASAGRNYGYGGRPDLPETPKSPSPRATLIGGAVTLALVSLAFSVSIIGSRTIGIQTQFNNYVSTLGSGFHMVRPWSDVERFTTRIQTLDLNACADCETDGDTKEAVAISFAGAGRGWAEFTPRWYVKDDTTSEGAYALWLKFRDYDTVRDTLVYPTARDTFRNVASKYARVDALSHQQEISDEVTKQLNDTLAKYGVGVDSVSLTGLPLDPPTQQSLDRINISAANVVNAENEYQRALKDAETAEVRAKSGILSPQGNLRYCLEVMNAWNADKNGPLPAGFSCTGNGVAPTQVIPLTPTPTN